MRELLIQIEGWKAIYKRRDSTSSVFSSPVMDYTIKGHSRNIGGIAWSVLPPKKFFCIVNGISAEQTGDTAVAFVSLSVK